MNVEGRCHCGEIKYEAEVEPGTVSLCHCLDCQVLTGAVFRANIMAPAATFRMLSGTPREYIRISGSGARRIQAFCGNCGSPVYSCAEHDPPVYALRVGGLSHREELGKPARQIWSRRRLSWVTELADIQSYPEQPK